MFLIFSIKASSAMRYLWICQKRIGMVVDGIGLSQRAKDGTEMIHFVTFAWSQKFKCSITTFCFPSEASYSDFWVENVQFIADVWES